MPEQGLLLVVGCWLLVVGCWLLVLFLYHRRSVCIYVNTFFAPPHVNGHVHANKHVNVNVHEHEHVNLDI